MSTPRMGTSSPKFGGKLTRREYRPRFLCRVSVGFLCLLGLIAEKLVGRKICLYISRQSRIRQAVTVPDLLLLSALLVIIRSDELATLSPYIFVQTRFISTRLSINSQQNWRYRAYRQPIRSHYEAVIRSYICQLYGIADESEPHEAGTIDENGASVGQFRALDRANYCRQDKRTSTLLVGRHIISLLSNNFIYIFSIWLPAVRTYIFAYIALTSNITKYRRVGVFGVIVHRTAHLCTHCYSRPEVL